MTDKTKTVIDVEVKEVETEMISLTSLLSKKPIYYKFEEWIIGDTPLITNAWSEKARRALLATQVKATKAGKEPRDPKADFRSSLYEMGDGTYGFPAMGFKNCVVQLAHRDKGIAKTAVQSALWLNADMVRVRPALAGAICDMPLLRIYSSKPEMREDMVKIGKFKNIASLAYRAQFTIWGMKISGRFNPSVLTGEALAFLIQESGMACGLGEWRIERKGMFGAFHLASDEEKLLWNNYETGKGPLPIPASYKIAA